MRFYKYIVLLFIVLGCDKREKLYENNKDKLDIIGNIIANNCSSNIDSPVVGKISPLTFYTKNNFSKSNYKEITFNIEEPRYLNKNKYFLLGKLLEELAITEIDIVNSDCIMLLYEKNISLLRNKHYYFVFCTDVKYFDIIDYNILNKKKVDINWFLVTRTTSMAN